MANFTPAGFGGTGSGVGIGAGWGFDDGLRLCCEFVGAGLMMGVVVGLAVAASVTSVGVPFEGGDEAALAPQPAMTPARIAARTARPKATEGSLELGGSPVRGFGLLLDVQLNRM